MSLSATTIGRRAPWLAEVERHTEAWRDNRARQLLAAGVMYATIGAESDETREEWVNVGISKWHSDRALAHRDRFSRLSECGSQTRTTQCACGPSPRTITPIKCDHWRLCLECRGRRAQRYRARFAVARDNARKRHERETRKHAPRRWSEKFLTLTVPHSGYVGRDVDQLAKAWPKFRARVASYLKSKGIKRWNQIPYWRSLEVTKSDAGHAHYHVWMLAPFLPAVLLRHWWGQSLDPDYRGELPVPYVARALCDVDPRDALDVRIASVVAPQHRELVKATKRQFKRGTITRDDLNQCFDEASFIYVPVLDVRACTEKLAAELIKYIVKDVCDGEQIDPETYAKIYASLDGARAVATSPHLIDVAIVEPIKVCECCNTAIVTRFVSTSSILRYTVAHGPPEVDAPLLSLAA